MDTMGHNFLPTTITLINIFTCSSFILLSSSCTLLGVDNCTTVTVGNARHMVMVFSFLLLPLTFFLTLAIQQNNNHHRPLVFHPLGQHVLWWNTFIATTIISSKYIIVTIQTTIDNQFNRQLLRHTLYSTASFHFTFLYLNSATDNCSIWISESNSTRYESETVMFNYARRSAV